MHQIVEGIIFDYFLLFYKSLIQVEIYLTLIIFRKIIAIYIIFIYLFAMTKDPLRCLKKALQFL